MGTNNTTQSTGSSNPMDLNGIIQNAAVDAANGFGDLSTENLLLDGFYRNAVVNDVLVNINSTIRALNKVRFKGEKLSIQRSLPILAVGEILIRTKDFVNVTTDGGETSALCQRIRYGNDIGIYKRVSTAQGEPSTLKALVRCLNPGADERFCKEVAAYLIDKCEKKPLSINDKLVWCNNGIFSFYDRDQGINPFTAYDDPAFEDKYKNEIHLWKLPVDYNPAATNPIIHNDLDGTDWDLDSHLRSPFSSDSDAQLWLEICHFAIRGKSGGISWWFLNASEGTTGSSVGGNGKNGQTDLLTHLLGDEKRVKKTPLERLGDPKQLWDLPEKIAIISDESNSTVETVTDCATLKNLAREQPVQVRKLYENPIWYTFRGIWIQALNGYPKIKEKTDSFLRRFEVIRFEKEFAKGGQERRYINDDYIKRKEVLEYFLKKLLDMDCLEQYTPECIAAVQKNKQDVREASSPVMQFMSEISNEFLSDFIPTDLLWDLFQIWEKENKMHYEQEKKQFKNEVIRWAKDNPVWSFYKGKKRMRTNASEPIVLEYGRRANYSKEYTLCNRWLKRERICNNYGEPPNFTYALSSQVLAKTFNDGIIRTGAQNVSQELAEIQQKDTWAILPECNTAAVREMEHYSNIYRSEDYFHYCVAYAMKKYWEECERIRAKPYNPKKPPQPLKRSPIELLILGRISFNDIVPYDQWVAAGKPVYDWRNSPFIPMDIDKITDDNNTVS